MRIGLLTTGFPQYPGDPSGCFVLGFAQALARRGHLVEVLAPASGKHAHSALRPDLGAGVRLSPVTYSWPKHRQNLFYGAGVPENLFHAPWLAPQLAQFTAALALAAYQRRHIWNGVVSHWALPCALVANESLPALPHLAVCHSADVHALCRYPGGNALRSRLQKQARALWFVSDKQRDQFITSLPNTTCQTHVSPMGFWPPNQSTSKPTVASSQPDRGRLRIATLSRLVSIKNLASAITAVKDIPELELHIAGDGPERDRLEQLAAGHRHIQFLGPLNEKQKWEHLRNSDVFLLCSRVLENGRCEGAPVALLEAMHCKLPVVATHTGGIPSLVQDRKSALLIPPDSPKHIISALRELLSSAQLRQALGEEGHRQAERYMWPELGKQAEALLTNGQV